MLLCGQLTENALTCVISIIVEAIFSFELLNLTIGSVTYVFLYGQLAEDCKQL